LQLAEVAHRLHAARQFGAGIGGRLHLLDIAQRLLRRHRAHPGLASAGCGLHQAGGEPQADVLLPLLGQPQARRQQQQVEHREAQGPRDLEFAQARLIAQQSFEGEHRVGHAGRLSGLGGIGRTAVQHGLQCRAVGERDAHGVVGTQRVGKQRIHVGAGLAASVVGGEPSGFGAELLPAELASAVEILFDGGAGATAEQQQRGGADKNSHEKARGMPRRERQGADRRTGALTKSGSSRRRAKPGYCAMGRSGGGGPGRPIEAPGEERRGPAAERGRKAVVCRGRLEGGDRSGQRRRRAA
jgi:hypothetical protein